MTPIEVIEVGREAIYVMLKIGAPFMAMALIVGLIRYVVVLITGRKVSAQQRSDRANPGNPLGRVLQVYEEHRTLDSETLSSVTNR